MPKDTILFNVQFFCCEFSVAHQENQRAIDEATDLFQQHLSELAKNLPYDEDTIRSLKKDKFKIVFEYFDEIAIGENRQKYREKLEVKNCSFV
jgi:hypothetical protein